LEQTDVLAVAKTVEVQVEEAMQNGSQSDTAMTAPPE
jgi:hypothetical protein